VGNKSVQEVERARRAEEGGPDARARSKELENRLGRLWDLERFSDEEGYRDRTRHTHLRYRTHRYYRQCCASGMICSCSGSYFSAGFGSYMNFF
jgi:hypothetical protein